MASDKLRELYGDKTILFLQVGSFYEMYDKYKNKEKKEIMGLTLMEEACNLLDLNLMYKTCYPGAGIKPEYSDKYIPPPTPIGTDIRVAIVVTIKLPIIALPMPPADIRSSPGGSGNCVRRDMFN